MSVKILSLYIENCKSMDKEPSWEGLRLFNKVFK